MVATGRIKDRPGTVTLLLALLVVGHFWFSRRWEWLNVWEVLQTPGEAGRGVALTLYLGLGGAAAMAAGFAGVVIVFGLTTASEKFLEFRLRADRSLRRNWLSVISSSFGAAALSFAAAILVALGQASPAPWLFEAALLLVAHAVLRMLWLLSELMRVVKVDDTARTRASRRAPLRRVFPPPQAS